MSKVNNDLVVSALKRFNRALHAAPFLFLVSVCVAAPSLAQNNPLHFAERTQIDPVIDPSGFPLLYFGDEVSGFLGSPNFNFQQTVDAEVGDVNGDGFMDIVDANRIAIPSIETLVVRLNNQAGSFDSVALGGSEISAATAAKLIDLTGNGRADLILVDEGQRRAFVFLNQGPAPVGGVWFDLDDADFEAVLPACPSNIAVGDLSGDSIPDFAVSQRISDPSPLSNCADSGAVPRTTIFINDGSGSSFVSSEIPQGAFDWSYDVFFLDANHDGTLDIMNVGLEAGPASPRPSAELFLSAGSNLFVPSQAFATGYNVFAGESADLNGDGFDDFVLSGIAAGSVTGEFTIYINDPAAPVAATFNSTNVPSFFGLVDNISDIAFGDIDVDGDLDILLATFSGTFPDFGTAGQGGLIVAMNDGQSAPTFNTSHGLLSELFPIPEYLGNFFTPQRLSVNLIDYDKDGDLDVYAGGGFNAQLNLAIGQPGAMPNQLFENLTIAHDVDADGIADVADNCPNHFNPGQIDLDDDGFGESCDPTSAVNPPTITHLYHKPFGRPPVFIAGPVNITSGTTLNLRVIANDSDGLGYPVFSGFGNPTLISYVWFTGGGTVPAPAWAFIFGSHPPVTFTLDPGESFRTFFVTLFVYDTLGNIASEVIEVNVTP